MTLDEALERYLQSLEAQGYAPRTIDTQEPHLRALIGWLDRQGVTTISEVSLELLRTHHAAFMATPTRFNRPPSISSQCQRIGSIRQLFAFLLKRGHLLVDPALNLELPRSPPRRIPANLPTPDEMERLVQSPDTTTPRGIRDRAILEVLYASAIRNTELRSVRVGDVDLTDGVLMVIQGKGRRDRMVPLSREACHWVSRYLEEVRSLWVQRSSVETLFLTSAGNPLHFTALIKVVKDHATRAGITKRVTVHTFRHACASHMLTAGADIRHLQALLGHKSLQSTAIYTHLDIQHLKRIHKRCHPRAKSRKRRLARDPDRDHN